jgi:hypothetical protein
MRPNPLIPTFNAAMTDSLLFCKKGELRTIGSEKRAVKAKRLCGK